MLISRAHVTDQMCSSCQHPTEEGAHKVILVSSSCHLNIVLHFSIPDEGKKQTGVKVIWGRSHHVKIPHKRNTLHSTVSHR